MIDRLLVHEGHASARKFFTQANAGSYDFVARVATFRQDLVWKRKIVDAVDGCDKILELACGTGILSSMLAAAKPGRTVVGLDLTFDYILAAKRKPGFEFPLAQATAETLPCRYSCFDAVVSSYLAKYVDIRMVVDECWNVLRPGGIIVFHDFTYPTNNVVVRRLWKLYFAVLRIAGRTFATSWKTVFEQLDSVIGNSQWVKQTKDALCCRGFCNIDCRYYTLGTAAIVSAQKP